MDFSFKDTNMTMKKTVLRINDSYSLELRYEDISRFSDSILILLYHGHETMLYEDFLYFFAECMLGSIKNKHHLSKKDKIGTVGKWMDYFERYSDSYIVSYQDQIDETYNAFFISGTDYGLFIYEYDSVTYLEIDRTYSGYLKSAGIIQKPIRYYYNNPENYRVLFTSVNEDTVSQWQKVLQEIYEFTRIR